jgi:ubiquinone/menaquinone biosynthesis C-methylase UbiE
MRGGTDREHIEYGSLASVYALTRKACPPVLDRLLLVSGTVAGSRVLEVGCGTGNYISTIQARTGCKAWGVDPSQEMLFEARSRVPGVMFAWGSGESLRFEDSSLDLVFSVDVIHHVGDREAYHAEAYRVIRPGGLLCTVTDNEWIIRNRVPLSGYFPDTVEGELERYPKEAELRREMTWAGFEGVRGETVEHLYELTDVSPYRERAFSCLHLISDEALARGVRRMELDLELGPIPCVARYLLLWGSR